MSRGRLATNETISVMNEEQQLRLQAFLDGELPEAEARDVANWTARDSAAAALLTELRHTRQALAGFENDIKVPESREFYWSRIARVIERPEPARASSRPTSVLAALRRFLIPATALAVLMIVGFVATRDAHHTAPTMEAALADTGAFTYRDDAAGMTVVWLSYPAENEFTSND